MQLIELHALLMKKVIYLELVSYCDYMKFKQSVIEALGYYVYCLVDPRDNKIFYIGKGVGNRVFQHAENAISSDDNSLKLNIIRDIIANGYTVKYYIIRHKLSEEVAYQIESSLIDLLTFKEFNMVSVLANIQQGHHQWDEGIKSVDEINVLYDCPRLEFSGNDHLLIVKLNRTYENKYSDKIYQRENIYEKIRKYWRLNPIRAKKADFVLAVFQGVVRAVYKPMSWFPIQDATLFTGTRYAFDGIEIKDSKYLNKDISKYIGGMSPIRYINI